MSVNIYVDGTQYTNIEQVKFPTNSNNTVYETFYAASDATILNESDLLEDKIAYGSNGKKVGKIPRLTDVTLDSATGQEIAPGTFGIMVDYDTNQKTLTGYFTPEGDYGAYINGATRITARISEDLYFAAPGDGIEHKIQYESNPPIDGATVGVYYNLFSNKNLFTPSNTNTDESLALSNQLSLTTSSVVTGYKSRLIDCGEGRFVALISATCKNAEGTNQTRALQAIPIKINLQETELNKKIIKGTPVDLVPVTSSGYQIAAIPLRSELSTKTNYIYVAHSSDFNNYYINHFVLELLPEDLEGSPGFTCKIVGDENATTQPLFDTSKNMGQYAIDAVILNGPKDEKEQKNWEIITVYAGTGSYPTFSQVEIDYSTKSIIVKEEYKNKNLITTNTHSNYYCIKVARMNDNRFAIMSQNGNYGSLFIYIIEKIEGEYQLLASYDAGSNYATTFNYVVLTEDILLIFYAYSGGSYKISLQLINNNDGTYIINLLNTNKNLSSYLPQYNHEPYSGFYPFRLNEGSVIILSNYSSNQYLYGVNLILNDDLTIPIGNFTPNFDTNQEYNTNALSYHTAPGEIIYSSDLGCFLILGKTSVNTNSSIYKLSIMPCLVSRMNVNGNMGSTITAANNIARVKERYRYYRPRFNFQ